MKLGVRGLVAALIASSFIAVFFQNCGDVRLMQKTTAPSVILSAHSDTFCVSGDGRIRVNKVLFLIDRSGSNEEARRLVAGVTITGPGNDPDFSKRVGSMRDYLEANRGNEYFRWGLISFQGTTTGRTPIIKTWVKNAAGEPKFGTPSELDAGLSAFEADVDSGGTYYVPTLEKAKAAIRADLEAFPDENSIYNVFMMSDGMPTDFVPGTGGPAEEAHFDLVRALVALSPGKVFFSTVYYALEENDPDRTAADGLDKMAKAGNGKFIDQSKDEKIDFGTLLLGPTPQAYMLRQFQVYNLNSAFCEDGQIGGDSDADGLCDRDEVAYNARFASILNGSQFGGKRFDPQNRNSFDPSFSDYFYLKKKVLPSGDGLPTCTAGSPDEDHDLLNNCEEKVIAASNPAGRTGQWTDMLIAGGGHADSENPDSDGDGFIDSLEFFTFGLVSAPVNYNNIVEVFAGGVRGAEILEQHRHYQFPARVDDSTYDVQILPTGFNDRGESCYSYQQNHLALYPVEAVSPGQVSNIADLAHAKNENNILIYYIAALETDPNGKKAYFRYSFQKLKYSLVGEASGAHINTTQFQTYEIPDVTR